MRHLSIITLSLLICSLALWSHSLNAQCINQYSVTGGGNLCNGTKSVTIWLVYGTQKDVIYELRKDGGVSGYPTITGTGNGPVSWTITSGIGTYTVIGKLGTCTQQMSGSAVVISQLIPTPSISTTGSGCSTTLTGSGGTSYAWRWKDPNGTVIATTQSIQPKKGGTYYLTATNDCGNTAQVSYNLSTITSVSISPNGSPVNSCPDILTLTGTGGTNYKWTLPDATTNLNSSLLVHTAGTYTLTANNICGIQETTSITVTMYPVLTPPTVTGVTVKEGSSNELTASGAGTSESYRWYNTSGTLLYSGLKFTTPILFSNTTYKVAKYTTSGPTTCGSDKVDLVVTVNKKPVINAGVDQSLTFPTITTTLAGTATDAENDPLTYTWSKINGGNFLCANINSLNTSVSDLDVVNYTIRLTVSDGFNDPVFDDVNVNVVYPPNNFNFIRETIVFKKNTLTEKDINTLTIANGEKSVSCSYVDGLGRPMQTVIVQGSPLKNDVVQPYIYDQYGRSPKQYMSVVVNENSGTCKPNTTIIDATSGNYKGLAANFYDDARPFREVIFENSPLDRPLKEFGTGSDWKVNDKATVYNYGTNVHNSSANSGLNSEKIIAFKILSNMPVRADAKAGYIETNGFYGTGQILITSKKDENGNEIREYSDKSGNIILKKVQAQKDVSNLNSNTQWALTYYIYDDRGNLRFVLQPLLSAKLLANDAYVITSNDLNSLCFQYKYDSRQRVIEKKIPGADAVFMVYDKLDRLVMTQDGNQRSGNKTEWSFTKYDVLSRPVMTGIYTHSVVLTQIQMAGLISSTNFYEGFDSNGTNHCYTNTVFPTSNIKILTVTYYDDYRFRDVGANLFGASYKYQKDDIVGQDAVENTNVVGLVTGGKTNVLGSTTYLNNVVYYDSKNRVIQGKMQNHRGGIDRVTNLYDFARLKQSKAFHNPALIAHTTDRKYDYDAAGRLTQVYHKIDTEPDYVLIYKNEFNERGLLSKKRLHSRDNGSSFSETSNYEYNIRGWLAKINDPQNAASVDLFGMKLSYNQPSVAGDTSQYNGNISDIIWKSAGQGQQSYGYNYDPLNRLLQSNYRDLDKPFRNGMYTEWIGNGTNKQSYDLNGNIKSLIRYGATTETPSNVIDNLTYTYANLDNSLTKLDDYASATSLDDGFQNLNITNDYTYDANGNMTQDLNKGIISITYNYLNLIEKVSKSSSEYIVYTYDASGKKLTQQVFGATPKTTHYVGEYVYETINGNDVLQFVTHEDGRIIPDNSVGAPRPWEYQYFLKDHLGNVRVMFSEKTTSTEYLATMETTPSSVEDDEANKFLNLIHSKKISMYNHTPGKENSYRLSGSPGEIVGPSKSFEVNAGEVYDLEAYARYEAPTTTGSDVSNFLTSIISAFALQPTGGSDLNGSRAYNKFTDLFSASTWVTPSKYEDQMIPKAFLNYILFDVNFNLVDFGFDQVSETSALAHDYLSLHVKVKQKGFLYIYLSNENDKIVPLFFDDFKIIKRTNVEQVTNYYGFGLTQNTNSFDKTGSVKNSFNYNGKELQDELNIGLVDYGARMYDPAIGRWIAMDQLEELYPSLTPYNYVGNNPVIFTDPDGRDIEVSFSGLSAAEAMDMFRQVMNMMLGGQFEVTLAAKNNNKSKTSGTFSVGLQDAVGLGRDAKGNKIKGDVNKLSSGQQAFYRALKEVIDDHNVVVGLNITYADINTHTGNYNTATIDMADVYQWPEFDPKKDVQHGTTRGSKMIHEIREQYAYHLGRKFRKGDGKKIGVDHVAGLNFENAVNGNVRTDKAPNPGSNRGIIETFEHTNGTVVKYLVTGAQNSSASKIITVTPIK